MTETANNRAFTLDLKPDLRQEELFPIREVSRITGVNPVTLRAWERRYGLIQPTRTDSGHRLYSPADIDEVRSILSWLERGVAVSKVSKILETARISKAQTMPVQNDAVLGEWGEWQLQIGHAAESFDERRLEQLYGQIFSSYPAAVVFQDIFMPVWRGLAQHQEQFGQTSQWLFLDSFLRARTLQRLQMAASSVEQQVVLAALPGQCRELELWVAGLLLSNHDTGVRILAMGQPLEELSLVCSKIKPAALVLFSNHSPAQDLPRRLTRLSLTLDCPLLLAGEVADLAQDALEGSAIACLGSEGRSMQRRLQQFLAGHLDS